VIVWLARAIWKEEERADMRGPHAIDREERRRHGQKAQTSDENTFGRRRQGRTGLLGEVAACGGRAVDAAYWAEFQKRSK
jgi:hypothetical protein